MKKYVALLFLTFSTLCFGAGKSTVYVTVDGLTMVFPTAGNMRTAMSAAGIHSNNLFVGSNTFTESNAANVPVTIAGTTSQGANLTEWYDSLGTLLAAFDSTGSLFAPNIEATSTLSSFGTFTANSESDLLGNVVIGGGSSVSELRLREGSGGGSNYTGFKPPATLAGNVVYEMPAADGGAGQYLVTNGSKVLAWGSPTAFTLGTGTSAVATTAFVTITGLSASIGAGETWTYHVMVPITGATNGCKFQVTGPASPTSVQVYVRAPITSASNLSQDVMTAFSSATSAAYFTSAFTSFADIEIVVANGVNAGTIAVQFATGSGTNTITALAGRYISGSKH